MACVPRQRQALSGSRRKSAKHHWREDIHDLLCSHLGVGYDIKLAPCGRTVLVDLVPDSPPIRTGHDGQRIGDERLGLTSAVLPAWAVSWALTTPRPLCLLAGYLVAGHNVPA